ncbi:MAG: ABC transporter permease [Lachnospiraceae bacterium]
MSWIDLLRMSSGNLRRRKLRTFLTVLGVVIGTASIVVMISLGLGMQQQVLAQVEQLGGVTNVKVYSSDSDQYSMSYGIGTSSEASTEDGDNAEKKYVTDESIQSFEQVEGVESVYPVMEMSVIILKGNYTAYTQLYGMPAEELSKIDVEMEEGSRMPAERTANLELMFGNWMPEMFYNNVTGQSYYETGEFPDIGEQFFIILDQEAYYAADSSSNFGNTDEDTNKETQSQGPAKKYVSQETALVAGGYDGYNSYSMGVYCDLDTLTAILKKDFSGKVIPGQPTRANGKPYSYLTYSYANVKVDNMENVETVANTYKEMGYTVETNIEFLNAMQSQYALVQAVLGGIGAISLLVAAIGITNTMMMSIYERTKEIGVIKVLGCGLKNIKQLFLLEAAGIGFLGGVLGNLLSFILSGIINVVVASFGTEGTGITEDISYIPFWLVLAAMGIAISVGMIAGYFPAKRAMKLSALEAIRTN